MRLLILGFVAIALLSAVKIHTARAQVVDQSPTAAPTSNETRPELIAVKFHADWCGSCRRMGSVFEDLTTVAEDQPVLFTRLDLTDRSSRTQAQYLMSMMNLGHIWEQAGAGQKTGFILLVDVKNGQPLGQLTADHDLKQMKAALLDLVAKNRG